MKKIAFLIIILLLTAGLFYATRSPKNVPAPTSADLTPMTLILDWTPNTDHTGIYVAQAKGWYKEEGIDLKILPFSSEVSATTLVSSGKADVGIGTMEDMIGNAAKGNKVVSIGAVLAHNTSGFLVLEESGIKSPKDFDGKIYGGYGSPFENAVVAKVIKSDGGKGEFKNVVLSVQAMQALESKKIDFVWVLAGWEVIQAKRDGFKTRFFPTIDYGIAGSPTLMFIASPAKIAQNPDLLKKFMGATAKGFEFARQNPKEGAQILISQAPKGTFPDEGLVYDSQEVVSREYADAGRKWGIQDKESWRKYPQFILDSGNITDSEGKVVKSLDFDSLYTNEFLP